MERMSFVQTLCWEIIACNAAGSRGPTSGMGGMGIKLGPMHKAMF